MKNKTVVHNTCANDKEVRNKLVQAIQSLKRSPNPGKDVCQEHFTRVYYRDEMLPMEEFGLVSRRQLLRLDAVPMFPYAVYAY